MFGCSKNRRALWVSGLLLLLVATALHTFEHWEIATHTDCISHGSESKNSAIPDHASTESGGRHDHGCGAHDHSAADLSNALVLQVHPSIQTFAMLGLAAPLSPRGEIDLPPRLI
jgi:hypothetical protein